MTHFWVSNSFDVVTEMTEIDAIEMSFETCSYS